MRVFSKFCMNSKTLKSLRNLYFLCSIDTRVTITKFIDNNVLHSVSTIEVVVHQPVHLDSQVVLGDRLACILLHASHAQGLSIVVQQEQRFEARSSLQMHVHRPVFLLLFFLCQNKKNCRIELPVSAKLSQSLRAMTPKNFYRFLPLTEEFLPF